jgi:hypothetical protein
MAAEVDPVTATFERLEPALLVLEEETAVQLQALSRRDDGVALGLCLFHFAGRLFDALQPLSQSVCRTTTLMWRPYLAFATSYGIVPSGYLS